MLLTFQNLLIEAGIPPVDARLLRHAKGSGTPGMHPYVAWRDHRNLFDEYQVRQVAGSRRFFSAPYWAAFLATPSRETMFVGLYRVEIAEAASAANTCPLTGRQNAEGFTDCYTLLKVDEFQPFEGKLFVQWGEGALAWKQYADRNIKPIVELRKDNVEEPYPGHSAFFSQLSQVEAFPAGWRAVLSTVRGVYLLSCPRTKEQYVGGAFADGGFLSRWTQHAAMSGDAIAFRSRDPEDYRVSILEVAGSLATDDDIFRMEQRWKEKLQSREMGLNRN